MEHQQHIVCVKASHFVSRVNGLVDYTLKSDHLILGRRALLEHDPEYRQILPHSVLTHKGKVWAYRRTKSGGEARLHGKVSVTVGGHWDLDDLVTTDSVIDLGASLENAAQRELSEEIDIQSSILTRIQMEKCICADDTPVDRLHLAIVYFMELDGTDVFSKEDQLDALGFFKPEELLAGDYELETWARIICERLIANAKECHEI